MSETKISSDLASTFNTFMGAFKGGKKKADAEGEKENMASEKQSYQERPQTRRDRPASSGPMNSTTQSNSPRSSIVVNKSETVKILSPKDKNDTLYIIDELRARQTVLVKLNAVDSTTRKEILDLIYGACYFAGMNVEKADDLMILIDPSYK